MSNLDDPQHDKRQASQANTLSSRARRMEPAELLGSHSHVFGGKYRVHVFRRNGRFLVRGRVDTKEFGPTLGSDKSEAEAALRRLLCELDDGTYIRSSEQKSRSLRRRNAPRHTIITLADEFMEHTRKKSGVDTRNTYRSRLAPVLAFAEQTDIKARWRLALDIDREFLDRLRQHLMSQNVTRNGRPGGKQTLRSAGSARQIMECLRTCLNWACRPDVVALPRNYQTPFTEDALPKLPRKDPLRPMNLTMTTRIDLVLACDAWQLPWVATLAVLPVRFEDIANAVIGDIDFGTFVWRFGSSFSGQLPNKCGFQVHVPIPRQLGSLLQSVTNPRTSGPLFVTRKWQARKQIDNGQLASPAAFEQYVQQALLNAGKKGVATPNDRKQVIQGVLRDCGGFPQDLVGKQLKELFERVGVRQGVVPYDIRGAVTTEMRNAGVRDLEVRYLTLHSTNDILNEYVTLDVGRECQKYFEHITPLLQAIETRATALGLSGEKETVRCGESEPSLVREWCADGAHRT
jgi:hypothetical protein